MTVELKKLAETSLSTELAELQEEAKVHLTNSKAENTKRAYRSDWTQFSAWCHQNGLQDLPATPETIVYYTLKDPPLNEK